MIKTTTPNPAVMLETYHKLARRERVDAQHWDEADDDFSASEIESLLREVRGQRAPRSEASLPH